FNINGRYVPAHPQDHALCDVRKVDVEVNLKRIISIKIIVFEQLIAEPALGRGVAVVHAHELRELETPVALVDLIRVGLPLEDQDPLRKLERIGNDVVNLGNIRIP